MDPNIAATMIANNLRDGYLSVFSCLNISVSELFTLHWEIQWVYCTTWLAVARAGEANVTFTAFPLSFPCDVHTPHLPSLVRQSALCLVLLAVSSKCLLIHYNKEYSCTMGHVTFIYGATWKIKFTKLTPTHKRGLINNIQNIHLFIINTEYRIVQWVYCTTWPAVARAGEASTYSRWIAYIPANSNKIFRIKNKRTLLQEMLEMLSFCINTSTASSEEICIHTH